MGEKSFRLERPFQIHASYIDGVHEIVSSGKFLATGVVSTNKDDSRSWNDAVFGIVQINLPSESAAYIGRVDPADGIVTFRMAKATWNGRMAYGDAKIYTGLLMWELDHAFSQVMEKQKRKRWTPKEK